MKSKFLFFTLLVLHCGIIVSCVEEEESDTSSSLDTSNSPTSYESLINKYNAIAPTLFTADEIAAANTAASIGYLTDEEKKVIMFTNLARLDGKRFTDDFAERYINLYNQSNYTIGLADSYVTSFYEDLAKVKGLPMLKPLKGLCDAAAYHAEDLGEHGMTGHISSDGETNARSRISRFLTNASRYSSSENCSFGTYKNIAVVIVMSLLIDNDIPSLGHRKNILNEKLTHIGVAIRPHKSDYKYGCVQDFVGGINEEDIY